LYFSKRAYQERIFSENASEGVECLVSETLVEIKSSEKYLRKVKQNTDIAFAFVVEDRQFRV
jgi:hypothetical protein